jgi:fermentation-respiration switch protein FrsA (DUF1100 family)
MLIRLAILYCAVCLLLYVVQDYLIFPGARLNPPPVTPDRRHQLLELPTPSGPIAALYAPACDALGRPLPDAATRPAVIYFYGNGACIAYSRAEADAFSRMGYNVLIPEYPGYPMSPGTRPSATGVYQAADASYLYLTQTLGVPPHRIAAVGQSIGGAPAVYLASERPIGALVTISAFRSLADIAAARVRHLFPVSLLVRHDFDNLSRMRAVRCPAFIAHGTRDELIPFGSAAALAKATTAPTTLHPVTDATHNDIYDVAGQDLMDSIGHFLGRSFNPQ